MKKVSIDFDEVLYNLKDVTDDFVKIVYGDIEHPEERGWDYFKEEFPLVVSECWNNPEIYMSGNLLPGATNFINELKELYHPDELQIVTSSLPNVISIKNEVIYDYFDIDVVHTKEKYKYTNGTILIDDAIHNIVDHTVFNPDDPGLLFDLDSEYFWNKRKIEVHPNIHRVTSYDEVLEVIEQLEKERR